MSDLVSLIKKSKAAKKEFVPSTIRMPEEYDAFIRDLAEHLSLSKQEMMLKLIEEGMAVAKRELSLENGEIESKEANFHLLNTNKSNSVEDHKEILRTGVAAAFYDPWKLNIKNIKKGDVVFLYESGKGIVAYGKASGDIIITEHHGNKDECYYQTLNDYKVLEKPFPASEIRKLLDRHVMFLKTMSGIPDGQALLDHLSDLS